MTGRSLQVSAMERQGRSHSMVIENAGTDQFDIDSLLFR
jgi:hypothetical protein